MRWCCGSNPYAPAATDTDTSVRRSNVSDPWSGVLKELHGQRGCAYGNGSHACGHGGGYSAEKSALTLLISTLTQTQKRAWEVRFKPAFAHKLRRYLFISCLLFPDAAAKWARSIPDKTQQVYEPQPHWSNSPSYPLLLDPYCV